MLEKIDDEKAIVRHGEIIGVMSLKNTRPVDPLPTPASSDHEYDPMAIELIDLMNGYRKKAGAAALKVDTVLMTAAQTRAKELTRSFSHKRPGGSLFKTVNRSIKDEIIARGSLNTAQEAAKVFMSWSEYKPIAMKVDYTKTGAAWVRVDNLIYWVQLFR